MGMIKPYMHMKLKFMMKVLMEAVMEINMEVIK